MKPINKLNFNHYFIQHDGTIYNSKMNLIKPVTNKNNGYNQVVLRNKAAGVKATAFYVHRLVAETYISNNNNLPVVNHLDFNKLNNDVSNLEWCTIKQNVNHYIDSKEFERVKFDKINSDRKLVEKGVNHYRIYKKINYISKLWNCNSNICYEILRLNTLKTNSRYQLSDVIRYEIAGEMKALGCNRFPHGWKDKLTSNYYKRYGILLTPAIISKIKSDINKKIL
jgi:hypothetical protein